jgi:hypothetical protein
VGWEIGGVSGTVAFLITLGSAHQALSLSSLSVLCMAWSPLVHCRWLMPAVGGTFSARCRLSHQVGFIDDITFWLGRDSRRKWSHLINFSQ